MEVKKLLPIILIAGIVIIAVPAIAMGGSTENPGPDEPVINPPSNSEIATYASDLMGIHAVLEILPEYPDGSYNKVSSEGYYDGVRSGGGWNAHAVVAFEISMETETIGFKYRIDWQSVEWIDGEYVYKLATYEKQDSWNVPQDVPDTPTTPDDSNNTELKNEIEEFAQSEIDNFIQTEAAPFYPGLIYETICDSVTILEGDSTQGWTSKAIVITTTTIPDGSKLIETYDMKIRTTENHGIYSHSCIDSSKSDETRKADYTPTMGEIRAKNSAKLYLQVGPFSYKGLYEQLKFEGYLSSEAAYGAFFSGGSWNDEAIEAANLYLSITPMSKKELYNQLIFDGFTNKSAQLAVDAVY